MAQGQVVDWAEGERNFPGSVPGVFQGGILASDSEPDLGEWTESFAPTSPIMRVKQSQGDDRPMETDADRLARAQLEVMSARAKHDARRHAQVAGGVAAASLAGSWIEENSVLLMVGIVLILLVVLMVLFIRHVETDKDESLNSHA